ncbi:LacI family DNA-binding transcriptional regulator [Jannaschia seohaensis]|uniref:LacI family transcriptional regulator n=1 Tax=Jannaschia seohaensis TaxID=475081 RepID=A0A2Y9B0C3_9RHOB|nr:substrate-binding domain-containing protein [Jannaschia seohaensis]PWJ15861.1 LacI family transcriptional regulator [Jannaschia seohaensis]SSA49565.1 LacI family transcriptional regulator [Jannaschia seohaensis]
MNLKEFAGLLGLSPTTVSRALGGYPEVREETRRRVTEAAKRHGYRPNRRAAALASGRAMAIGHVIPTALNQEVVNPVFADFISGAGEVYSSENYDLTLSIVTDGSEDRVYRQMAQTRSVDGVIVHGPRIGDQRIPLLQELGLPFVVHGRLPGEHAPFNFVDIDNIRAFHKATDLLLDLGHRRIALLNGNLDMDFACRRRDGFASAMSGRGVSVDPDLLFAGDMSETNGHGAARRMLEGPNPPTAFLVSSLTMAIGVRRATHELGLRLGQDVSLVTHDDVLSYLANGPQDAPLFTATRSSVRAAGRRCAEILIEQITRPGLAPIQDIWECELVIGASTGPAPNA